MENMMKNRFIAIDFETANHSRNSACALGIALVEKGKIVEKASFLIRPPVNYFCFTDIHGITWEDVKDKPSFETIWPNIAPFFKKTDFAAAHNAPFDRSVLEACCGHYGICLPSIDYRCTLALSRENLTMKSHSLDSVCSHLGIELNHHEALSDATACAKIMIQFLDTKKEPQHENPRV